MGGLSDVEPIADHHATDSFDCGKHELDDYLKRYALINARSGIARTFVVCRDEGVVGYYSLASSAVTHEEAPERVKKRVPRYPIPVVLLARLAVTRSEQGQGLGAALLKDALLRIAEAAGTVGIRAVLVHAKDDEAASFYDHFNFEPSPTNPLHLFLLMQDLRTLIATAEHRHDDQHDDDQHDDDQHDDDQHDDDQHDDQQAERR